MRRAFVDSSVFFADIVLEDAHHSRARALFDQSVAEGRERISPEDETNAIAILRGHDDKAYSFCDALSFAVMDRLRVTEAVAYDRDFQTYGRFTLL